MRPTFDDKALRQLGQRLATAGRQVDKRFLSKAFTTSLKPLETIVKREAPVGKTSSIQTHRVRISRSGQVKRDRGFDKGGATRRDIRTKIVAGEGDEYLRGLVGIDKRTGHIGWRGKFIIKGTRYIRPNDFLSRAEKQGVPLVIDQLAPAARQMVEDIIKKIR